MVRPFEEVAEGQLAEVEFTLAAKCTSDEYLEVTDLDLQPADLHGVVPVTHRWARVRAVRRARTRRAVLPAVRGTLCGRRTACARGEPPTAAACCACRRGCCCCATQGAGQAPRRAANVQAHRHREAGQGAGQCDSVVVVVCVRAGGGGGGQNRWRVINTESGT
jgi:hypothetical protein